MRYHALFFFFLFAHGWMARPLQAPTNRTSTCRAAHKQDEGGNVSGDVGAGPVARASSFEPEKQIRRGNVAGAKSVKSQDTKKEVCH